MKNLNHFLDFVTFSICHIQNKYQRCRQRECKHERQDIMLLRGNYTREEKENRG